MPNPNLEGATVYTNTSAGYIEACLDVGALLTNLEFSLAMENEIMVAILNDGEDTADADTAWMAANPNAVMAWLDGVTTIEGGDAAAAVGEALRLLTGHNDIKAPAGYSATFLVTKAGRAAPPHANPCFSSF